VRVALAAGLLAGGASLMPAAAADLGGNCCADLEERVAELEATTARKGNRKVSFTVSGQVSTAVMFWDDGHKSDVYVVDNTVSRTGFQFDGSAKINPNLTAGFQIVIGISSGARSHQVNQKDDDASGVTKLSSKDKVEEESVLAIELANWYLDHKHFGRLAVGRVGTAADGTTIVDLGGAGVIANAEIGEWQQGFFLAGSAKWADIFGGSSVSRSSQARGNGIIYTTPTLHGFSASVSWGGKLARGTRRCATPPSGTASVWLARSPTPTITPAQTRSLLNRPGRAGQSPPSGKAPPASCTWPPVST
jgi:hypothetical protein